MNLIRLVLVTVAVVVVDDDNDDAYLGPYQDFVPLSFQSASAVAA